MAGSSTAYTLVALDLDGTAVRSDGDVSERLKEAVKECQRRHITVMLATGRMVQSAVPYWQALGLGEGPLVAYQGAVVAMMPEARIVEKTTLPQAGALAAVRWAIEIGLLTQVYVGQELWISREDPRARHYIEVNHIPGWVRGAHEIMDWPEPPIKVLLQDEGAVLDAIRGELEQVVAPYPIRVFKSQTDYLEIVHDAVGKAKGVAEAARLLGIERQHVLTVGDAENDLDMLEWAGMGVAMGQAPDVVKRAADAVTAAVDEDGAALALERFVLQMPVG